MASPGLSRYWRGIIFVMKIQPLRMFFISMTLGSVIVAANKTHGGEKQDERTLASSADILRSVDELGALICDPEGLLEYLKQSAIERERKATGELDETLRGRSQDIPADRQKVIEAAVEGSKRLRERFRNHWTGVGGILRTHRNARMRGLADAIQPHMEAVDNEYKSSIERLEYLKEDGNAKFTGIECSACNVTYQPLNTGLRQQKLGRGSERKNETCPKYDGVALMVDGKKYTLKMIAQNSEIKIFDTEKKQPDRVLRLPQDRALIKAIADYYEENSDRFKNITDSQRALIEIPKKLLQGPDPREVLYGILAENEKLTDPVKKFSNTLTLLKEHEPKLKSLVQYMEDLSRDPSREKERQLILTSFGIPEAAILASPNLKNNNWSEGYTVDYSLFPGGPPRNQQREHPMLVHVRKCLVHPSMNANHVLLKLTKGACFFCDAAKWHVLKFPK